MEILHLILLTISTLCLIYYLTLSDRDNLWILGVIINTISITLNFINLIEILT